MEGGSTDTDVTAVAVVPWRSAPLWTVTMLTVVARRRIASRNWS